MASDETLTLGKRKTANYGDGDEGGVHLVDELKEEVLCRLPVKTLLRFRAVCTKWKTLIDSNRFKKKHFQSQHQQQHRLMWLSSPLEKSGGDLCLGDPAIYTLSPPQSDGQLISLPLDIGQFLDSTPTCHPYPIGVVDGLVYFTCPSFHVICNPATKKVLKKIQNLPSEGWNYKLLNERGLQHLNALLDSFHAFGFDPKAEDYKFVMGIFVSNAKDLSETKVLLQLYSLRRDSWREDVVDAPAARDLFMFGHFPASLNGKAYWYARKSGHEEKNHSLPGILEFDFSNESFKTTVLPVDLAGAKYGVAATLDGGSLGLIVTFGEIQEVGRRCEIWVMEAGGGDNGSWTKKLTCSLDPGVGWPRLMPVPWKEGSEILAVLQGKNQNELLLIDAATGSCKILDTGGFQYKAFAYAESLFSI